MKNDPTTRHQLLIAIVLGTILLVFLLLIMIVLLFFLGIQAVNHPSIFGVLYS